MRISRKEKVLLVFSKRAANNLFFSFIWVLSMECGRIFALPIQVMLFLNAIFYHAIHAYTVFAFNKPIVYFVPSFNLP